jgi:hypothetical protein
MQNKPNLWDTQMTVGSVKTKYYENKRLCRRAEYKPNQTQPVVSLPAVSKVEPSNLLQTHRLSKLFAPAIIQLCRPGQYKSS